MNVVCGCLRFNSRNTNLRAKIEASFVREEPLLGRCAVLELFTAFRYFPSRFQAAPNDIQRLWTAIDRRIQALKRGQDSRSKETAAGQDHAADDEDESKTEHDDDFKGTEGEDDDDSVKDRCEVPDESSSNDSCPTGEGREKESHADADVD